jgi:hypothetical protein
VPDAQADLDALAARLHGAAARLKAGGGPEPPPGGREGADGEDGLTRVRRELEAANAAVGTARERLAAVEARLFAA